MSRSKIELFVSCPRCFYLDRRLGVAQPPGFPFNLNSAVDHLLKKEFDRYRSEKKPHPLTEKAGLGVIPFIHEKLDEWRDTFKGVTTHHLPTNLLVTGAVDDLWIDKDGKIMVVDYKATSKASEVSIDADWQHSYKRQMEVYQWLLRQNGFDVSPTGYFVYCNGRRDRHEFGGMLEFDISLIPYTGDTAWIAPTLHDVRACLESNTVPMHAPSCDFCRYRQSVRDVLHSLSL